MEPESAFDKAINALGELLIVGLEGKTLKDDTAAFLSQAGVGGIILFSQNYESPKQLAKLINQIQECRKKLPLWICADQEGGRVQRFREGFTSLPPAARVSKINSPKGAFSISEINGKELNTVGVNLNFAPVADIVTNDQNEVIGDRAYGSNETLVSRMVSAAVRGIVKSGVQPCVKHFPGHGNTSEDSHIKLPKSDLSVKQLRESEFKPFTKAFKSRCNMVMTAHILNPNIDPDFPATLSKKTLTDLLRGDLRFSRLIISDDMEMGAITDHFGEKDAPVRAINAGCDLLIYRSEAGGRKAYEALRKALEDDKLSFSRVIESAERSRSVKSENTMPYQPAQLDQVDQIVGCHEHQQILEELLKD